MYFSKFALIAVAVFSVNVFASESLGQEDNKRPMTPSHSTRTKDQTRSNDNQQTDQQDNEEDIIGNDTTSTEAAS